MPKRTLTSSKKSDAGRVTAQYRPALVTFLDILGFGNLIRNSSATQVQRVLRTVRKFTTSEGASASLSFAFSDSIVRVRFLDGQNEKEPQGLLATELLDVVHAQGELIQYDTILRGGISSGNIYVNGTEVFGPALVRAYELETKAAIYPRIVLDPLLLNETKVNLALGRAGNSPKEDRLELRKFLKRGENGYWFVDYLNAFIGELDSPDLEPSLLQGHKRLITTRRKNGAPIDKILWLAVYHNNFVSRLPNSWFREYGIDREKLEVTTNELPDLARLPKRPKLSRARTRPQRNLLKKV